jgi:26S proteasome regulatory subunit N3
MQRLAEFNRRTLDVIAARIYFYFSLAYELTGELASIRRWVQAMLAPNWAVLHCRSVHG